LTLEGHTYQPNSEFVEPDIDNLQVIGFSIGFDQKDAFRRLLKENSYLIDTAFDGTASTDTCRQPKNRAFICSVSPVKSP